MVHTNNKDVDGNDMVVIGSAACEIKKVQPKSGMFRKKNGTDLLGLLAKSFTSDYVTYTVDEKDGWIYSRTKRFLENPTLKELETLIFACAVQADTLEKEKHGDDDVQEVNSRRQEVLHEDTGEIIVLESTFTSIVFLLR